MGEEYGARADAAALRAAALGARELPERARDARPRPKQDPPDAQQNTPPEVRRETQSLTASTTLNQVLLGEEGAKQVLMSYI